MTRALNQVGIDGAANTATLLTGGAVTATNTLLQSITLASQANVFCPFVKRVSGTGTIEITIDNGTTWTDITSSINSTTFTQVQTTKTAANPVIGFRITTNGDSIAVDMAGMQSGTFRTSPIPNTNAVSVSRPIDLLTYPNASNINGNTGTAYAEATYYGQLIGSIIGDSAGLRILFPANSTLWQMLDGNGGTTDPFYTHTAIVAATPFKIATNWAVSTNIKSWKNDVEATYTTPGQFTPTFGANTLQIGAAGGGNSPSGDIRNIRIYSVALNATQVAAIPRPA
jgi:hypothetical protein